MPIGWKTLRRVPLQEGHSVSGSSRNDWTTSRCSPQSLQRYSYVGIGVVLRWAGPARATGPATACSLGGGAVTGRRLALSLWECQRTGQVTRGATARDGRRRGRGPYHRPIVPLATAWPPITAAAVVASYAAGTLPTAQLVGRHWGVDPTATGSRNPGATNVYRTAGRRAGALTLVGDLCKGAVAAGAGWALGGHGLGVACGVAAVVGHVLPVT